MTDTDLPDDIEEQIDNHIEERLADLGITVAEDPEGQRVSLGGLMEYGLSRRQALYALGLVSMGALVPQAIIQAVSKMASGQTGSGSLGTASSPLDNVYTINTYLDNLRATSGGPVAVHHDLDFQSSQSVVNLNELNGGGPLSEGDGTERQMWVIANGANDPSGADPEDIILEEES